MCPQFSETGFLSIHVSRQIPHVTSSRLRKEVPEDIIYSPHNHIYDILIPKKLLQKLFSICVEKLLYTTYGNCLSKVYINFF